MDTKLLWRLPPDKFNEWRIAHDYPALFKVFEQKLPYFNVWINSQNLSPEVMFNNGFARFISSEEPLILCEYKENNRIQLFSTKFTELNSIRKRGWIDKETEYKPYFHWLKLQYGEKKHEETIRDFRISSWINGRPQFLREHFLLNLGGVQLTAPILSGRFLDFTCLDNLKIIGAISNTHLFLWHCSAVGIEISGGLAYLDFYKTKLWDNGFTNVKQELTLKDGIFQDFHFKNCDLRFHATRSTLTRCSIEGNNFDATLEHSKLDNISFRSPKTKNNTFHARKKFYEKAKSLFSSVGNNAEAGRYFYKEKKNYMLSLLFPKQSNWMTWQKRNLLSKIFFAAKSYLKFLGNFVNYLVWGFGERPVNSLIFSLVLIIGSALVYFLSPCSETFDDPVKSIYFSIVTFVTLGYGDISQKSPWLQIYSSIQALTGMVLMGLFLAGFASKSKQY